MQALVVHRKALSLVIAAVAGPAALAACGSSGASSGTTGPSGSTNITAQELSFVRCARSHGVPTLPDPGSIPPASDTNSQPRVKLMGITFPAGITPQSPAFQTAMQACKHLLPQGGARPTISASQRRRMIAMAQCMRTHGVPNFPDPQFGAPGGGGVGLGPNVNSASPAFQKAANACRSG
jgi:hypothetical protein